MFSIFEMLHPMSHENNEIPCCPYGSDRCAMIDRRSAWLSCFKLRDGIVLFLWTLNESDLIVLWIPPAAVALRCRLTRATRFHALQAFKADWLIKLVVFQFAASFEATAPKTWPSCLKYEQDESSGDLFFVGHTKWSNPTLSLYM